MFLLGTSITDEIQPNYVKIRIECRKIYLDEESFCENEENVSQ